MSRVQPVVIRGTSTPASSVAGGLEALLGVPCEVYDTEGVLGAVMSRDRRTEPTIVSVHAAGDDPVEDVVHRVWRRLRDLSIWSGQLVIVTTKSSDARLVQDMKLFASTPGHTVIPPPARLTALVEVVLNPRGISPVYWHEQRAAYSPGGAVELTDRAREQLEAGDWAGGARHLRDALAATEISEDRAAGHDTAEIHRRLTVDVDRYLSTSGGEEPRGELARMIELALDVILSAFARGR